MSAVAGPRAASLLAASLLAASLLAASLLAACAARGPSDGPRGEAPAGAVAMPGPRRGRQEAAVALNLECERCHEPQARQWRASLHQRADVEPSYRRSFAIEPLPFCRGCHAPEADAERPEGEAVAALGVGCVTCHVTDDGGVLAAPSPAPREAPHRVLRDARFAGDGACGGCHQFSFPGATREEPGSLMQSTMLEHRRSRDAAVPCAGCHMPQAGAGRDHSFAASRGGALLAGALRVEARRPGPTRVLLTLTPQHTGHALPTGDLFRRLALRAEARGVDGAVLGRGARFLTRHFELRPGQFGRRLVADDRPGDEPVTVELDVGPAGQGRPIAWRVDYQRVGHPDGVGDADAALEGEVSLASGVLAPE